MRADSSSEKGMQESDELHLRSELRGHEEDVSPVQTASATHLSRFSRVF